MRKLMLLTFGVGLWLMCGLSGKAQEDEARALIAKAIKAHGGEAKLAAVKAVQLKGKGKLYSPMELPFTVELSMQPPDKLKAVIELDVNNMNFTVTQVINGKKGWSSLQGMTKPLDETEMKEAQEQLHVEKVTHLVGLQDKAYKLSALGEMKVEGKDAVGVQVTKKGFRDVNLYFDKKSHLLLKAEYRAVEPVGKQEVTQEKFFQDYKDLPGGLKVPGKMLVHNDGKKFMDIEISETTPMDTPFDDSVFAKP